MFKTLAEPPRENFNKVVKPTEKQERNSNIALAIIMGAIILFSLLV